MIEEYEKKLKSVNEEHDYIENKSNEIQNEENDNLEKLKENYEKQISELKSNFAKDELRDNFLEWKEKYEKQEKLAELSTQKLEEVRTRVATNNSESQEKSEQLKFNNMLLGLTNVTGDGVVITVKDSQIKVATDDISSYLVHDGDLREIVSELSNAGAEAISINDQRIVSSTCIVCAGNVISINGQKVSSPFVIKAIGNQESLYGLTRPGGYLQYMEEATIPVDIKKVNNIQILNYTGTIPSEYMNTIE